MTNQHPITPPQWQMDAWQARIETMGADVPSILLEVAQWGADQELEACCQLLDSLGGDGEMIRRYRRPKPPSLKEQALEALEDANLDAVHYNTILRALEALPDD